MHKGSVGQTRQERGSAIYRETQLREELCLTQNTLPPLSPWTWATTSHSRSKNPGWWGGSDLPKVTPKKKVLGLDPNFVLIPGFLCSPWGLRWVCFWMKPSRVQPPPAELKARTPIPKHDLGLCDWEKSKWWTGTFTDYSKWPVTQTCWCLRMLSSWDFKSGGLGSKGNCQSPFRGRAAHPASSASLHAPFCCQTPLCFTAPTPCSSMQASAHLYKLHL